MGRVEWFCIPDSYIGASTGRVEELSVQANDAVYNSTRTRHTWRRTFIRPMGAYALRAANWPFSGVSANRGLWNEKDGIFIALRWIPACLIASFCLPFARTEANIRPDGKYRDFPYRYWTYPHASRNPKEDSLPAHFQDEEEEEEGLGHFYSEAKHERILRPRLLCHLKNPKSKDLHGIAYVSSDEDEGLPEERRGVPYVFVAYTADQFSNRSKEDLKALSTIAEIATRDAGLEAYWIAASCFAEEYQREDVYRISDVIRGAHSVVIVLGQPCNSRTQAELGTLEEKPKDKSAEELLQDWGRRMWTFPEALLCPSDKIKIYLRSGNAVAHVDTISKQDFPGRAWHDKLISRQLMDHFLGSLTLSRLEIVVIALECLRGRKTTLTRETMDGELTYVLMGLLRRRPKPNKDDSAFQAFAKLSLSNDSDRYLERLICVQPTGTANRKRTGNELLTARDVWGCCLWDIYPLCQVAAIGHGDSVILDGCSGAAIKWDRFESAPRIRGYSYRRFFIKLWLRLCPILFLVGAAITQWANDSAGGIILAIASLTIFFYPILIIRAHSGKVWDTQAELFGFEGYVDIRTIECLIWGFEDGRLDWSICGSSLSRHSFNADNECIGRDPTDDPLVKARVKLHEKGQMQHKRIFTIVDTKTMQVSLIEAVHPPVLALACGKEGGMVR